MPPSRPPSTPRPGGERATTDLIRWAAFSCVLVPVVLLWYGTSLAGATGTAAGLAAVTAVCRLLLRQSERGAARLLAEEEDARGAGAAEHAPQAHHRGRHQRTGTGSHRGRRHSGGNSPAG
ncbi:hypothetical protein [Streptomyces sp. DSM 15324]|uniref:hypothetical protein n=1 Tax=Streptomyces sp. DSM 15324 TaxID=1739111 RepID=UPI000749429F|nr:hypothetical protein [Streptomyces sp. DSM 15324]KUO13730.1 hypothetical protein AQJ58_01165 [Streptomyces sp. DSM 15324]